MSKKELEKNEMGAYPCKACMRRHIVSYPVVKMITGLPYAQCSNPECDRFDPYEFIGSTKKGAILNWNETMGHDYDSTNKKSENE